MTPAGRLAAIELGWPDWAIIVLATALLIAGVAVTVARESDASWLAITRFGVATVAMLILVFALF